MHFVNRDNLGSAQEAGNVVIGIIKCIAPCFAGIFNRSTCPLAFAVLPAAQLWQAGALAQAGRTPALRLVIPAQAEVSVPRVKNFSSSLAGGSARSLSASRLSKLFNVIDTLAIVHCSMLGHEATWWNLRHLAIDKMAKIY
jgi:hypothetical protein